MVGHGETMLYQIKNLRKSRAREQGYTLFIRDLTIEKGAKIAVTGPSGCGKSTALDILGLSLRPDSASQFLFSPAGYPADIEALWRRNKFNALARLRLRHIGYVLQSGELLPYLSAGENMTLTAELAGMSRAEAVTTARKLAARLGIEALWNAAPATLSVGERQRAAIARALTPHPDVILADEPTAALDPHHAEAVMGAFLSVLDEFGGTLILVTHNAEWARKGGLTEIAFRLEVTNGGVVALLDNGGGKNDTKR